VVRALAEAIIMDASDLIYETTKPTILNSLQA